MLLAKRYNHSSPSNIFSATVDEKGKICTEAFVKKVCLILSCIACFAYVMLSQHF